MLKKKSKSGVLRRQVTSQSRLKNFTMRTANRDYRSEEPKVKWFALINIAVTTLTALASFLVSGVVAWQQYDLNKISNLLNQRQFLDRSRNQNKQAAVSAAEFFALERMYPTAENKAKTKKECCCENSE